MKPLFSDDENRFITENYLRMPYKQIADVLHVTERQIRGRIATMGLKKTKTFNNRYFNVIDTPNKAYWMGLIYADGYLIFNPTRRTYECSVELKDEDKDVLELLNSDLGGEHPIFHLEKQKEFNGYSYRTSSNCIRVYSKPLVMDLMSNSIVPNKTNSPLYPKVDDELFWHFLRGFMDGDGCIYLNKFNRITVSFTNSNKLFLSYINDSVEHLSGIKGSIYRETDKKYKLVYFKIDSVKQLLEKIYDRCDKHKLIRKYRIYTSKYGSAA